MITHESLLILKRVISCLDRAKVLPTRLLSMVLLLLIILLQLVNLLILAQVWILVISTHIDQILKHDLMIRQLVIDLAIASTLFLLM